MQSAKPKVIIVGGGPVGLTAALGLARAEIEFVLLEQRENIIAESGSDMTVLPMVMPALDQLGLLATLSKAWVPVSHIDRIDHTGQPLGQLGLFKIIQDITGYSTCILSRSEFLKCLYEAIPSSMKNSIMTGKNVCNLEAKGDGVTVRCSDGDTYEGTFIIGADGAHSKTRKWMQKMILGNHASGKYETKPFTINYQALWIRFPADKFPGCRTGSASETHGSGVATQLFAGKKTATIALYRRLSETTYESLKYNKTDQLALVEEWAHLPLIAGGKFCLKDVFEARLGSGLVNLEEGVVPNWSYNGRVVLVGDAAHKFTPSMGSGMNYGIVDVVTLVNELYGLQQRCVDQRQPWWHEASLSEAFRTYQTKRLEKTIGECKQAGRATAMATWMNFGLRLFDRYILPNWLFQRFLEGRIAAHTREAKPPIFCFKSVLDS